MRIANTLLAILLATTGVTGCASSEADRKAQKEVLMKSVKIPVEGDDIADAEVPDANR